MLFLAFAFNVLLVSIRDKDDIYTYFSYYAKVCADKEDGETKEVFIQREDVNERTCKDGRHNSSDDKERVCDIALEVEKKRDQEQHECCSTFVDFFYCKQNQNDIDDVKSSIDIRGDVHC